MNLKTQNILATDAARHSDGQRKCIPGKLTTLPAAPFIWLKMSESSQVRRQSLDPRQRQKADEFLLERDAQLTEGTVRSPETFSQIQDVTVMQPTLTIVVKFPAVIKVSEVSAPMISTITLRAGRRRCETVRAGRICAC